MTSIFKKTSDDSEINKEISWNDFIGTPDYNLYYYSHIFWNIYYTYIHLPKKQSFHNHFRIYCSTQVQISPKSWVKSEWKSD